MLVYDNWGVTYLSSLKVRVRLISSRQVCRLFEAAHSRLFYGMLTHVGTWIKFVRVLPAPLGT